MCKTHQHCKVTEQSYKAEVKLREKLWICQAGIQLMYQCPWSLSFNYRQTIKKRAVKRSFVCKLSAGPAQAVHSPKGLLLCTLAFLIEVKLPVLSLLSKDVRKDSHSSQNNISFTSQQEHPCIFRSLKSENDVLLQILFWPFRFGRKFQKCPF